MCAPYEKYANQDYVPQKPRHHSLAALDVFEIAESEYREIKLSKREREIVTLMAAKLTNHEIAKQLDITLEALRQATWRIRKKYENA